MTDKRSIVAATIEAVGTHRWVRVEVMEVAVVGNSVELDLVIHFARSTPVCCGQLGCYLGFLGRNRTLLPEALGHALGIRSPTVAIRAQLRHEPGYRYIDHRTGQLVDEGVDHLQLYGPDHFDSSHS